MPDVFLQSVPLIFLRSTISSELNGQLFLTAEEDLKIFITEVLITNQFAFVHCCFTLLGLEQARSQFTN